MNKRVTEFVVFVINEVANRQGIYPSQAYKIMEKTGCIHNYLVPFYDILHTMGVNAVVDDVLEYVCVRGEVI